MGLEPISKDDFCGEKILASREGVAEEGLGGRNFCPPSLSAAAEFRISLCEMRRQEFCLTSFK